MTIQTYPPGVSSWIARILAAVELVGLGVIAVATVLAGALEIAGMVAAHSVTLADLLLLFIYLEVLSMVALYLEYGAMPVRVPLYIAMVALARHLILDTDEPSDWLIVATAIAILILAAAILLIRYGHVRFPYQKPREK